MLPNIHGQELIWLFLMMLIPGAVIWKVWSVLQKISDKLDRERKRDEDRQKAGARAETP